MRNFKRLRQKGENKDLLSLSFPENIFESETPLGVSKKKKKKETLVSGNAGDEKNLHPSGRKFISFNQFSRNSLFSSLVSFAFFAYFFVLLFLLVCFLKLEIYILIHIRLCGRSE